jgi:NAD(P)H dehydrogenase (quinone)
MSRVNECEEHGAIGGAETPRRPVRVAIVYHSVKGHVAKLAEAVVEGVQHVPEATADLVALYGPSAAFWEVLDRADALVFGCPTYMGGVSSVFKAFAEQSLGPWLDNLRWRNKVAAGFTHSQAMSGDKLHALQYFTILAAQHGMLWVPLDLYPGWCSRAGAITDLNRLGGWLGVISQSDRDAALDAAPNSGDLETARYLGRRVAEVTRDLLVGRRAAEQCHGARQMQASTAET